MTPYGFWENVNEVCSGYFVLDHMERAMVRIVRTDEEENNTTPLREEKTRDKMKCQKTAAENRGGVVGEVTRLRD